MPRSSSGCTPTDAQTRSFAKSYWSRPGGGLPAHVLHLARAHLPALGIRFGRVVVVARLRGPGGVDVRIERPVRQIHAAHRIGQGAPLQRRRREPELAVPGADAVARARLAHGERQHALGAERRLGLRIGDELGRSAEFAVLRLPLRIEHRDRIAALALDLTLVRLPAARVVADPAQRRDEIVLGDRAVGAEPRRRLGAAERADELLFRRVPGRLAAAGRAGEFRQRDGFGHPPGSADQRSA